MKVYIAARAKYRAAEVAEIQRKVKALGFDIAYDWSAGNSQIAQPYRAPENRKANLAAQSKMLKAAKNADIFVFIDDPGLRGAYVELGAFLTDCLDSSKGRRAYIVGPNSHQREFIFESPEYVYFVDSIGEVYSRLAKISDL